MNRKSFDFKKMRESVFRKLKKKKRTELTTMTGVYDELPAPRPTDPDERAARDDLDDSHEDYDDATSNSLPNRPPPPLPRASTASTQSSSGTPEVVYDKPQAYIERADEASPEQRMRGSRHIVHENEHGVEIEYAVTKKESLTHDGKLNVKDNIGNGYENEDDATAYSNNDWYLKPSTVQSMLGGHDDTDEESSIDPRYTRHIDILPAGKDHKLKGDTSSEISSGIKSTKKKKAPSPPPLKSPSKPQVHQHKVLQENKPTKSSEKTKSLGSFLRQHSRSDPSQEEIESTKKEIFGSSQVSVTKQVPFTSPKPETSSVTQTRLAIPEIVVPNKPIEPAHSDKSDSEKGDSFEIIDGVLQRVPAKKAVSNSQRLDQRSLNKTLVSQTPTTTKEQEVKSGTVRSTMSSVYSDASNTPTKLDRTKQGQNSGGKASNGSSRSSPVQSFDSPDTIPANKAVHLTEVKPDKKQTPSYHRQKSKEASTQYEQSNPEVDLQSFYKSSTDVHEDNGNSAIRGTRNISHDAKAREIPMPQRTSDVNDNDQNRANSRGVVMKTRGTSILSEADLSELIPPASYRGQRYASEDDDAISTVHYKPKDRQHKRIVVETYRETGIQTGENTHHDRYLKPRAFRPSSEESTKSHVSRFPVYDDQSELSTKLSSEWYKHEDSPQLWDPDRMLEMFAEELDKKSHSHEHTKSGIELRKEFDPKKYMQYVPNADSSGTPFPHWKRVVMAKRLAEQTQMEHDRLNQRSEGEIRFDEMPVWKKAILRKTGGAKF